MNKSYQLEFDFMKKQKESKEDLWKRQSEMRGRLWEINNSFSTKAIRSAQRYAKRYQGF